MLKNLNNEILKCQTRMAYPVDCSKSVIIKDSKIVAVLLQKLFHIAQKHTIELAKPCTHHVYRNCSSCS